MNLPVFSRLFRRVPPRPANPAAPGIEPLEARISPATLISLNTVTYQDDHGDTVTVTISKNLFTPALVNKIFTFDTGSVNGSNTLQQQLETLDLSWIGQAARGINVTVSLPTVNNGPANIGYINSSGIDLGTVIVPGDLGRIAAGDFAFTKAALVSLTVDSMGLYGTATQAAGGNLTSLLSGTVGAIVVNGDVDGAAIGIGGGVHGILDYLKITGSLNGNINGTVVNNVPSAFTGSIRTQGTIYNVEIDGSIIGGPGLDTGTLGTAAAIGSVLVKGSILGGAGTFSGAILSTGAMAVAPTQSIHINGDILGGPGPNSGQVGTASSLGTIVVGGSVEGSGGMLSGVILAHGNIASVTITNGLVGGIGTNSGEIGAGGSIGAVTIGSSPGYSPPVIITPALATPLDGTFQGIESGYGAFSGEVTANGNIVSVTVNGSINGLFSSVPGIRPDGSLGAGGGGPSINAGGGIGSITVTESVTNAGIVSGASIGPVVIQGSLADSTIHAAANITSVAVYAGANAAFDLGVPIPGILGSTILADFGSIGALTADGNFVYNAITGSLVRAGGGIGSITATISNPLGNGDTIDDSGFDAGAPPTSPSASFPIRDTIYDSGFDAGGSIGSISSIDGSIFRADFIAGIDLGPSFAVSSPGTFGNMAATSLGYGGSNSSLNSHIGAITLTAGLIQDSTFLAGVHGPGPDGLFGTRDDSVARGSTIGAITSPVGLNTVFMESGSIGATTTTFGPITDTTYIATDSAVSSAGIGPITVVDLSEPVIVLLQQVSSAGIGAITVNGTAAILNSTFISNAGIGNINVTINGYRAQGLNAGILGSNFQAGHAIGSITVSNSLYIPLYGAASSNYGIGDASFTAGVGGVGGIGDISSTISDTGPDGATTAIIDSYFDATFNPPSSAGIASIYADNEDASSTAAGIVDSIFRTHGSIGAINSTIDNGLATAPAVEGSIFSAFGSIGQIDIYGEVTSDAHSSRFLAGYDIGNDMIFGNEDLTATSLALHSNQSVGNVTVSGYFIGSDVIASVNPGAGYTFGANNNTTIGNTGSIGLVSIGSGVYVGSNDPFTTDAPASNAIEAANFALGSYSVPSIFGFGYTPALPVLLTVPGGVGDVRITYFNQPV